MAWFLEYRVKGKDAYPRIWAAMEKPEVYERDIVKFEVLKHFGSFVTESSIHMSEYAPYFLRTPELIDQHIGPKMWGVGSRRGLTLEQRLAAREETRRQRDEENRRWASGRASRFRRSSAAASTAAGSSTRWRRTSPSCSMATCRTPA